METVFRDLIDADTVPSMRARAPVGRRAPTMPRAIVLSPLLWRLASGDAGGE
jgi:hypothetical protein